MVQPFMYCCNPSLSTALAVLKAQSIKNGKYVAIKCMKNHFDSLDQVNNLREIQALRRLSPHANIIKLLEVRHMPRDNVVCTHVH